MIFPDQFKQLWWPCPPPPPHPPPPTGTWIQSSYDPQPGSGIGWGALRPYSGYLLRWYFSYRQEPTPYSSPPPSILWLLTPLILLLQARTYSLLVSASVHSLVTYFSYGQEPTPYSFHHPPPSIRRLLTPLVLLLQARTNSLLLSSSTTLQRNLDLYIPRKGIAQTQSQFPHSCVCERCI